MAYITPKQQNLAKQIKKMLLTMRVIADIMLDNVLLTFYLSFLLKMYKYSFISRSGYKSKVNPSYEYPLIVHKNYYPVNVMCALLWN